MTILIVDDDKPFREMLRTVFETHGFDVLLAESTLSGLGLARRHTIDAVLVDYQMSKTNGLGFCRTFCRQYAAMGRHVPVWIMTGSVSLTTEVAVKAGATAVFSKPFSALQVCRQIERRLAQP